MNSSERETKSIRSSARQRRDEHDHDPRAPASSVSRRRRYPRPGEEDGGGYAGSGSAGPTSTRTSRSSLDERAASASFNVLGSEEDEEEGSSWGGTGSTSDGGDGQDYSSSCENYDTEEGLCEEATEDEGEGGLIGAALGGDGNSSEEDQLSDSEEEEDCYSEHQHHGDGKDELSPHHHQGQQQNLREQPGRQGRDDDNSVEVCVVTWNLAEESPSARDLEFLRHASRGSDLVAVGVQEIENLKPRRNEGGRTREWRRLLIR